MGPERPCWGRKSRGCQAPASRRQRMRERWAGMRQATLSLAHPLPSLCPPHTQTHHGRPCVSLHDRYPSRAGLEDVSNCNHQGECGDTCAQGAQELMGQHPTARKGGHAPEGKNILARFWPCPCPALSCLFHDCPKPSNILTAYCRQAIAINEVGQRGHLSLSSGGASSMTHDKAAWKRLCWSHSTHCWDGI